ncbi:MAG: OmpA family protein [Candidatus Aminicenantes bacterium]|nr:OmpA family protein [Candidatus Aminicenantes bacterium]
MKKITLTFLLSVFLIMSSLTVISFQDTEKLEHPVIKPMPGANLIERSSKHESYFTLTLRVLENGMRVSKDVSGEYWRLRYEMLDSSGEKIANVSRGEIIGNYVSAALEKGGTEHTKGSNSLVFSVPRKDGGTTWAKLIIASADYTLDIIDEKPLVPVLSFGAEELKKALDAEGRIAVYGINFAVDSDRLQLGAEKILSEFVKLMTLYPDLKIEIQGHTDNTGAAAHNLDLSSRRAESVKEFILLFGVDSSRLVSKGYGMTVPIDSNDTEEGRAKNRRVELVKIK